MFPHLSLFFFVWCLVSFFCQCRQLPVSLTINPNCSDYPTRFLELWVRYMQQNRYIGGKKKTALKGGVTIANLVVYTFSFSYLSGNSESVVFTYLPKKVVANFSGCFSLRFRSAGLDGYLLGSNSKYAALAGSGFCTGSCNKSNPFPYRRFAFKNANQYYYWSMYFRQPFWKKAETQILFGEKEKNITHRPK